MGVLAFNRSDVHIRFPRNTSRHGRMRPASDFFIPAYGRMEHRSYIKSLTYDGWVNYIHTNPVLHDQCVCDGCWWMSTKGEDMIFDAIGKPDHVYERVNNQVNRLWWSKCPQRKHLLNVNKRKQGNGKPKGIWAGTFTMSPSDPYNEEDMVKAVRKLFSQNTSPVKKYSWYVERTENDLPHIHFCYQTPDGGRILAKVFKRVWPIWNEDHSVGRGHRGGYHTICASPDDYLKYISKDNGRHDTHWPEDE